MAVNFRDKIAGVTNKHAGNCYAFLGYQARDVGTPADIRLSVAGPLYRRVHFAVPFPSSWWSFARARVCVLTSWAAFYVDVALPGCAQTGHLPYFPSDAPAVRDLFVIFRSRGADGKDTLKVLAATRTFDEASLARIFSADE